MWWTLAQLASAPPHLPPPPSVQDQQWPVDLLTAWWQPDDPFSSDITSIWGLHSQTKSCVPVIRGCSLTLLWAVTFVPEWNFDSFLIFHFIFCVAVCFLFSLFPSGLCPLCTCMDAFFWHSSHHRLSQTLLAGRHGGKKKEETPGTDGGMRRRQRVGESWR